ncbi:MAG: Cellulase (glycosyl hydrolase family 5), partial [Myxococcaceae bacterium]|nr:Cellulase (glycosyl hydrolase family 5) [Myxococcaceae bacterium]
MARTLAVLLILPSLALAAPTVAVNGHLPSPADSASIKALGAASVRMDFNWFDFQPTASGFTWAYLDPIVDAARVEGLNIYATVAYSPQWAGISPSCVPHSPDNALNCDNKRPADKTKWAAAVTAVVTRYKGKVECWGIWNEPNLRTFFDGTLQQFVDDIFLPAAAAIRAADPQAKICGPELAGLTASSNWNGNKGTCIAGSCIRNGWELDLGQLLDQVGSQIDVITQHTYKADPDGVMKALLDGESVGTLLTHDSIRHVIDTHGGANKEFWLTETGWEHPPQGGTSLTDVATRIVGLYSKQEEVCAGTFALSTNDPWRNWRRTYYYHFPYDPGSGWGLLDATLAPLPPYTALQTWAAGRTTTACTGASVTDGGTGGGAGGGTGGGSAGGAGGGAAGGAGGGSGGGSGGSGGGSGGTG